MKNLISLFSLLLLTTQCSDVYEVESNFKTIGYETPQGEFKIQRGTSELEQVMQRVIAKISPSATKFGKIVDVYTKKVMLENGTSKYFLFAKEINAEATSIFAISLATMANGEVQFQEGKTCVHRCTSNPINPCSGNCSMTILEECYRVMCSCTGVEATGGCNAEIVITYN